MWRSTLARGWRREMDDALHELCQPLTVLQCRLAMGELIGEPGCHA